jgi:hypothetical protein
MLARARHCNCAVLSLSLSVPAPCFCAATCARCGAPRSRARCQLRYPGLTSAACKASSGPAPRAGTHTSSHPLSRHAPAPECLPACVCARAASRRNKQKRERATRWRSAARSRSAGRRATCAKPRCCRSRACTPAPRPRRRRRASLARCRSQSCPTALTTPPAPPMWRTWPQSGARIPPAWTAPGRPSSRRWVRARGRAAGVQHGCPCITPTPAPDRAAARRAACRGTRDAGICPPPPAAAGAPAPALRRPACPRATAAAAALAQPGAPLTPLPCRPPPSGRPPSLRRRLWPVGRVHRGGV